jgi:pyruvate dehydrogenase E2 component (dihydrolipoamide acetyltransferase)
VAVEGGLLTVVQKDSDSSTLSKIATDNRAMIVRARDGKIKPADVEGSTFTVSNLGPFDVDDFVAIINPPEAAILAVSSAKKVPVVVDNEIKVGIRMKATISADHRVTDGAEAAQFMQRFKEILQEPMRLLV